MKHSDQWLRARILDCKLSKGKTTRLQKFVLQISFFCLFANYRLWCHQTQRRTLILLLRPLLGLRQAQWWLGPLLPHQTHHAQNRWQPHSWRSHHPCSSQRQPPLWHEQRQTYRSPRNHQIQDHIPTTNGKICNWCLVLQSLPHLLPQPRLFIRLWFLPQFLCSRHRTQKALWNLSSYPSSWGLDLPRWKRKTGDVWSWWEQKSSLLLKSSFPV